MYLFPWTLLVIAALARHGGAATPVKTIAAVRFALAASVPLWSCCPWPRRRGMSISRPRFPASRCWSHGGARDPDGPDPGTVRALRATAALMLVGSGGGHRRGVELVGCLFPGTAWASTQCIHCDFRLGLAVAHFSHVWRMERCRRSSRACSGLLLLAYCALTRRTCFTGVPASGSLAGPGEDRRAVKHDAAGGPLILLAPDETTRAMIDMYARTSVDKIPGPLMRPSSNGCARWRPPRRTGFSWYWCPGVAPRSRFAVRARADRRGGAAWRRSAEAGNCAQLLAALWPALRAAQAEALGAAISGGLQAAVQRIVFPICRVQEKSLRMAFRINCRQLTGLAYQPNAVSIAQRTAGAS